MPSNFSDAHHLSAILVDAITFYRGGNGSWGLVGYIDTCRRQEQ